MSKLHVKSRKHKQYVRVFLIRLFFARTVAAGNDEKYGRDEESASFTRTLGIGTGEKYGQNERSASFTRTIVAGTDEKYG